MKVLFRAGLLSLFFVFMLISPKLTSAAALDWAQTGEDGLGNINNGAIYALEEFGDYLYAGTWNLTDGAEIYRTSDLETWTQVNTSGFVGIPHSFIYDFQEFNSELYVSTYNALLGGAVFKTSNGTDWSQVSLNGFGDTNNKGIVKLYAGGGMLLAGTWNTVTGTELWYTTNGTVWTQTDSDGFGDANNAFIGNMVDFDSRIYVSTYNDTTGAQIWRKPLSGSWEQVTADGLGDANNICFYGMIELEDQLIIGSRNNNGAKFYTTTNGTAYTLNNTLDPAYTNIRDYTISDEGVLYSSVDNANGLAIFQVESDSFIAVSAAGFGEVTNILGSQFAIFEDNLMISTTKISGGAGEIWYVDISPEEEEELEITPSKIKGVKIPEKKRKVNSVRVKWTADANADKYYVKLMTNKKKKIKIFKKVTKTRKTVKNKTNKIYLKSNKPYKVKVRGVTNGGLKGKWSKIKKFRTKPAKVKELLATQNTTVGGADFSWKVVRGKDITYLIKIYDSYDNVLYNLKTEDTALVVPILNSGEIYKVKVRAIYNKNNKGKWSDIYTFLL